MSTAENPHAGQGMVVVDIGGDIGALIVHADQALDGIEIEIAPAGRRGEVPDEGHGWWIGDWRSHHHDHHEPLAEHRHAWPHVAVIGRPRDGEITYAAVYPGLREGAYELWTIGTEGPVVPATVSGATVTEVDWPGTG